MSKREQILEAVKARLEAIAVGIAASPGGPVFETDAGSRVFVNEAPPFGPDDPDTAIAVFVLESQVSVNAHDKVIELIPLDVQALARAEMNAAWQATEPVLADIKRALELPDKFLGGLADQRIQRGATRTLAREEGSTAVGVAIVYGIQYSETWGHP